MRITRSMSFPCEPHPDCSTCDLRPRISALARTRSFTGVRALRQNAFSSTPKTLTSSPWPPFQSGGRCRSTRPSRGPLPHAPVADASDWRTLPAFPIRSLPASPALYESHMPGPPALKDSLADGSDRSTVPALHAEVASITARTVGCSRGSRTCAAGPSAYRAMASRKSASLSPKVG